MKLRYEVYDGSTKVAQGNDLDSLLSMYHDKQYTITYLSKTQHEGKYNNKFSDALESNTITEEELSEVVDKRLGAALRQELDKITNSSYLTGSSSTVYYNGHWLDIDVRTTDYERD